MQFLAQKPDGKWPSDLTDEDPDGGPPRSTSCPEQMGPCTNFQWMDIARKNFDGDKPLTYFSNGKKIKFDPKWFFGEPNSVDDEPCLFYGNFGQVLGGVVNLDYVCYPAAGAVCEVPADGNECPGSFNKRTNGDGDTSMCLKIADIDGSGSVEAAQKACSLLSVDGAKVVEPETTVKVEIINNYYLELLTENNKPVRQFWIGAEQFDIPEGAEGTDWKRWYWRSNPTTEIVFDGKPISDEDNTVPWLAGSGYNTRSRQPYIQQRGNGGVWKDVSVGNRGAGVVCTRKAVKCYKCPRGYSRYGKSCFKYLMTPANTIDEARSACEAEKEGKYNLKPHLIAPQSEREHKNTMQFLAQKPDGKWPSDLTDEDPDGGPPRSTSCPEQMGPCTNFQWMDIARKNFDGDKPLTYFSNGKKIKFDPKWFFGEPNSVDDEPCLFYGNFGQVLGGVVNLDYVCYPAAGAVCEVPADGNECPGSFNKRTNGDGDTSMCLKIADIDGSGSVEAAQKACSLLSVDGAKVVEPETTVKVEIINNYYLELLTENNKPVRQFWIGAEQFDIPEGAEGTDWKRWYWRSNPTTEIVFDGKPISDEDNTVPWLAGSGYNTRSRQPYIQQRGNGGVWKDVSVGNRGAGVVCTLKRWRKHKPEKEYILNLL